MTYKNHGIRLKIYASMQDNEGVHEVYALIRRGSALDKALIKAMEEGDELKAISLLGWENTINEEYWGLRWGNAPIRSKTTFSLHGRLGYRQKYA